MRGLILANRAPLVKGIIMCVLFFSSMVPREGEGAAVLPPPRSLHCALVVCSVITIGMLAPLNIQFAF